MIISLDYDDTYSSSPAMWDKICKLFMDEGHTVICVSARHPDNMQIVKDTLGRVIGEGQCIGVDKEPKRQHMIQQYGITVDVWIDDMPETIVDIPLLQGL